METAAITLLITGLLALAVMFLAMLLTESTGLVVCLCALSMTAITTGAVCAAIQSERDWAVFSQLHECVRVGHMSGSAFTTVGVGANGGVAVGVGSTPDKTGWKCNDGVTYWR